jgi:hypothetical protein
MEPRRLMIANTWMIYFTGTAMPVENFDSSQSDSYRICREGGKTIRRNSLRLNTYRLTVFPANFKIDHYRNFNALN